MKQIGIIGTSESGLDQFLQMFVSYFDLKYVRTLQTKSPFVLLPTSLCTQIRQLKYKSQSMLQKKLNGILVIKNLENQKTDETHEILVCDMSNTPNQVSTVALNTLNSDPLKEHTFFNIGDFAATCSEIFVLISCAHPLENQLKQIPLLNFFNKQYHIYITHSQEFAFSKRQEIITQMQTQISRFFLERNLHLTTLQRIVKLDTLDYCADNNELIMDIFQNFQETPLLLQKRNNEYIFRLCCIHDESVNSTSFINKWEQRSDGVPPTRGVDIHIVNRNIEDNHMILQIFDLVGTIRWQFIAETFMTNCKGYFLVYDLARMESQELIRNWVELIERKTPLAPILIIGLKNDTLPPNNNVQIEKEWLSSHPLILDHLILSSNTGENVTLALDTLLEKIITLNFIKRMDSQYDPRQMYMNALENRKIYQELLQIFEINHKVSADVFTDIILDYFNHIPLNILQDFFCECLSSMLLVERFYALNLLRYYPYDLNIYSRQINQLLIDANPYYRYFFLTSLLFRKKLPISSKPRPENQEETHPITKIKEYIINNLNLQNRSTNFDIDPDMFLLIMNWIPNANLSEEFMKQKLNENLVHFSPEIRKNTWELLQRIDPLIKNQTIDQYLMSLSKDVKKILLQLLTAEIIHPNIYLKKNAITFFGILHDPRAIWSLITAFIQKDDSLKESICHALWTIDPLKFPTTSYPRILDGLTAEEHEQLANMIQDRILGPDDLIRLSSIKLLYDLKDPHYINPFIIALSDAKDTIRFIAIQALGEFRIERAIIPLLDCYVHCANDFSRKEILQSIHLINPERFPIKEYKALCLALTSSERFEYVNRLIHSIQRTYDEQKRLSLITHLNFFNEPSVLKLLIELMHDTLAQIQHTARENLMTIARLPAPHNIHEPEQMNLIFRALDDFVLYSHMNFDEYITTFSWQQVMKATLYTPFTESNRLYTQIPLKFNWNLDLLYLIRKKSFVEIFRFYLGMEPNEIYQKTVLNFLALSYPYSHEFLLRYIREHENSDTLTPREAEKLQILANRILQMYTLAIPVPVSDPNDTNGVGRNILL